MELFLIELMLWGGLILFFWIMKNRLSDMEAEIEALGMLSGSSSVDRSPIRYHRAESVTDPIGTYMDLPIHRFAVIDGQRYQFDHICSNLAHYRLSETQRCLAPGVVYCVMDANSTTVISA